MALNPVLKPQLYGVLGIILAYNIMTRKKTKLITCYRIKLIIGYLGSEMGQILSKSI